MSEKTFDREFGNYPTISEFIEVLREAREIVGDVTVHVSYDGYDSKPDVLYSDWESNLYIFIS